MLLAPLAIGTIVFVRLASAGRSVRAAALLAFAAVMACAVAITEVLSLGKALTPAGAGLAWMLLTAVALGVSYRSLGQGLAYLRSRVTAIRLSRVELLAIAAIGLFLAGTVAEALLYPTVNYDSVTAHMPRVFFWIQNGSVGHYPTPSGAQLFSGTTTAYTVLHLELLTGGSDRLANLAGWLSYAFALIAVTLVARELGASRRGQLLSALVAAAAPMALLQASTTQTDMTTALWCLGAVWALLRLTAEARGQRPLLGWAVAAGVMLGLAVGAKASAIVVLAPFGLWLCIALPKGRRAPLTVAVVLLALVLNAGFYTRNAIALHGDPIGASAPGMSHILVQDRTLGALAVTAVKNASMLFGTPSERVNDTISGAVRTVVGTLGGNVDDTANAEALSGPYHLDTHVLSHDIGSSPAEALLLLASGAVALLLARRGRIGAYAASAVASFVLIAAVVNWNLYINRILLPSLMLGIPLAAVALDAVRDGGASAARYRYRPALTAALGSLVALHLAWGAGVLLLNSTNRLLPSSLLPNSIVHRDVGWWNTSYHDLRYRILTPGMEAAAETIAREVKARDIHRIAVVDHASHTPVYALLAELQDVSVHYSGESVLPEREGALSDDEAVIEFVRAEDYRGTDPTLAYLLKPTYVPECDAYLTCYCAARQVH